MRAWIAAALVGGCSQPPSSPVRPDAPFGVVPGTTYAVGARPRALAIGDLDGDHDPDIVVAESGADRASLLLNDGRAAFAAGASLPAGREPSDVRAIDVDRDGDLDLVVANHETSGITVLANDGKGSFTAANGSPLDAGSRPHLHGVVAADLDGDGLVDLAVDSVDDDSVRVFFGQAGGFAAARAIRACAGPYYKLGAADVSGDGVADLLVPCQRRRELVVMVSRQRATLSPAAQVPLPELPWVAAGGDLDGDGRAEIVVVLETAAAVLRGDVASGFAQVSGSPFPVPGVTDVAIGDLDGDATADLAIGAWEASEVVVLLGGTFDRRTLPAGRRPIGLGIGDLDGDGRGELVAASNLGDEVWILRLPR